MTRLRGDELYVTVWQIRNLPSGMFWLRRLANDLDHSGVRDRHAADHDVGRLPGHRMRIDISENTGRRAGFAVRGDPARFQHPTLVVAMRSEERRVGKEGTARGGPTRDREG